jgi:ABC-type uncharacterized transport system fused permease/ATPase subunit
MAFTKWDYKKTTTAENILSFSGSLLSLGNEQRQIIFRSDVIILQKPYVIQGTLRDQVRYPAVPASLSTDQHVSLDSAVSDDARVLEALHSTDLGYLVHRGDGLDQIQVRNRSYIATSKLACCSIYLIIDIMVKCNAELGRDSIRWRKTALSHIPLVIQ